MRRTIYQSLLQLTARQYSINTQCCAINLNTHVAVIVPLPSESTDENHCQSCGSAPAGGYL